MTCFTVDIPCWGILAVDTFDTCTPDRHEEEWIGAGPFHMDFELRSLRARDSEIEHHMAYRPWEEATSQLAVATHQTYDAHRSVHSDPEKRDQTD